ncbi:MAG: alcohol dehydrogenase [Desulfuromonas sp.]|nr:MAG: alcohol dehydrogenase [Desulfuromonas sp.]
MSIEQQLRKFLAPEYVFGPDARRMVGQYAKNLGAHKVFVVSDPGVVAAGWTADVTASLDDVLLPWTLFTAVSSNPRAEEVMAGAAAYAAEQCNLIVAVGGGSPIDCAKGVGIVSSNGGHILDYEGIDRVPLPMPPLICIPTTGGTSADVSQFAIFSNPQKKNKIAIVSKSVVPDLALIDPQPLTTMDAYLSACTGLDALTHAIEAFVSNAHSPMTDLHALESVRLLSRYLLLSLQAPDDVGLRSQVMMGSLQAGLAFSNAILGANHALANSLGGFLDLAHGECNATLIDHVIAFNYDSTPERFDAISMAMGLNLNGLSSRERKEKLLQHVRFMKNQAGIANVLSTLGVSSADVAGLALNAHHDPCLLTNPRSANVRDLEVLYEESL